jgi:hypothetical protein
MSKTRWKTLQSWSDSSLNIISVAAEYLYPTFSCRLQKKEPESLPSQGLAFLPRLGSPTSGSWYSAMLILFQHNGLLTHVIRGPSGIWTLRAKKKAIPPMKTRFEYAIPSFTHMVNFRSSPAQWRLLNPSLSLETCFETMTERACALSPPTCYLLILKMLHQTQCFLHK